MDKQHKAAMALLDHLEDIQGAATKGTWSQDGYWVVDETATEDDKRSALICKTYSEGEAQAIASGKNAMPAFFAIARGQLEGHYRRYRHYADDDCEDHEVDTYIAEMDGNERDHLSICQHLASIPGESPEVAKPVAALKEALDAVSK